MSKLYAGLDVSDLTTAVCVADNAGAVVFESSVATTPTAIEMALKPYKRMLGGVGLETGSKSAWLHRELQKRRFPVVCLDARRAHAALSAKANKTDKNDARGLASFLCRGIYTVAHVKSIESQRTRMLLAVRGTILSKALSIELSLRMTVKAFGASLCKTGGKVVVTSASQTKDPMLLQLAETMTRSAIALRIEAAALERIIEGTAKADPICRRLMTIPGVGPITAVTFRAAVDDPGRFNSSRTVGAHFGLTPRRYQSGQFAVSGRISKYGDKSARTALYRAAVGLLVNSKSKCALRTWGLRLWKEKGFKLAAAACARKLAVVMHRMWVTGRDFDLA